MAKKKEVVINPPLTEPELIDLALRAMATKHFIYGPGFIKHLNLYPGTATGGLGPDFSTPSAIGELLFMARKAIGDDGFCVISAKNLKGEIRWGWQGVGYSWDMLFKSEAASLVSVLESF